MSSSITQSQLAVGHVLLGLLILALCLYPLLVPEPRNSMLIVTAVMVPLLYALPVLFFFASLKYSGEIQQDRQELSRELSETQLRVARLQEQVDYLKLIKVPNLQAEAQADRDAREHAEELLRKQGLDAHLFKQFDTSVVSPTPPQTSIRWVDDE